MKGEYIGKDGRTYRWEREDTEAFGFRHRCLSPTGWFYEPIKPEDWPAAKAALDELIESEQEEWVEWETENFHFRCKSNGDSTQVGGFGIGSDWYPIPPDPAYRKGLEVGKDEGHGEGYRDGRADAQEQIRELVEAIGEHAQTLEWTADHDISGTSFGRIVALARKVELL